MKHRPIVLWYLPVSDTGGVLRHALDVAATGMARHDLVVVVPSGTAASRLRATGARVVIAPVGVEDGPLTATRALHRLAGALRPAIVHSHLAFADVVLAATPLPRGTCRITTEHGIAAQSDLYQPTALRQALMPRVHAVRMTRFDAAIAVSQATARQMRRQWRTRVPLHILPNGVDPLPVRPASGHRVLALSRLSPEKRLDLLLDSFGELHRQDPRWSLTVGGEGELRSQLEAQADRLGLDESVRFPGFIDASAALVSHDVLVQLSEWENCSYSLLDAVVSGLGVVATAVGGNTEILPETSLTDGTPADVARTIQEQALEISRRPRLPHGWPTVATMVDRLESIYEEIRS